jgi:nicotinamide mononucleotide transporter PnuC
MSAPMAALAVISWVRNPYEQGKAEVRVNRLKLPEVLFLAVLTILVTVLFYFILKFFGTANLLPSTLSVTTSFLASYLTFRRSPFYALAYAANDLVLIVLWILAALEDPSYLPMILCFAMFFLNDTYGFINWQRMQKRQKI